MARRRKRASILDRRSAHQLPRNATTLILWQYLIFVSIEAIAKAQHMTEQDVANLLREHGLTIRPASTTYYTNPTKGTLYYQWRPDHMQTCTAPHYNEDPTLDPLPTESDTRDTQDATDEPDTQPTTSMTTTLQINKKDAHPYDPDPEVSPEMGASEESDRKD